MDKSIDYIFNNNKKLFLNMKLDQLNNLLIDYYLLLSINSFDNDVIQKNINYIHTILYNKKNN